MAFWNKFKKKKQKQTFVKKKYTGSDISGFGNTTADWLNWSSQYAYYKAYQNIPQLMAVINNLAKAYINGDKTIVSEKKIKKTLIDNILEYPNPLQSKYEFWETFYKNYALFNRVHVYKVQTQIGLHQLIVLPTIDVDIVGKSFDIRKYNKNITDFIDYYIFRFRDGDGITKSYKLDAEDVWTFTGSSLKGGIDGFLYPDNDLQTLLKPLSNIELNYKSRNELLKGMGAIGIISSNASYNGQSVQLENEEIEKLQKDFRKYSLAEGDYKYLITKANIQWTPMTVSVESMKFTEGLQLDTDVICDIFNYPGILLAGSQRQSKYANMNEARQFLYTDKIMPDARIIDFSFNANFKEYLFGDKLFTDYSNLKVLQENQKIIAETNKINNENIALINKQIATGIITRDNAINQLTQQGYNYDNANLILTNYVKPTNEI